jgi:hypothetical protein
MSARGGLNGLFRSIGVPPVLTDSVEELGDRGALAS